METPTPGSVDESHPPAEQNPSIGPIGHQSLRTPTVDRTTGSTSLRLLSRLESCGRLGVASVPGNGFPVLPRHPSPRAVSTTRWDSPTLTVVVRRTHRPSPRYTCRKIIIGVSCSAWLSMARRLGDAPDFVWAPNAPGTFPGRTEAGRTPAPRADTQRHVIPGRLGHPARVFSGRTKPSGHNHL